ncbi:hypothetical protein GOP47_0004968 [Adiantum capillus-veneris]|uniref:C2 domain-containing protein n=1 Tax=Adiantum capillus-veneris TaxID=13818 RepID=A0A9D4V4P2_ADICA|nr:hypothetical protein GOP47_0004968 [Adiantum capillus-veneris]
MVTVDISPTRHETRARGNSGYYETHPRGKWGHFSNKMAREHKSKTIHDGGKSPVWNESFLFEIPDGPQELDIHMFDQKKHGSDEAMGSVNIPLIKLFGERQIAPALTRFNDPMASLRGSLRFIMASSMSISLKLMVHWTVILLGNPIHMPPFTAIKKSRGAAFAMCLIWIGLSLELIHSLEHYFDPVVLCLTSSSEMVDSRSMLVCTELRRDPFVHFLPVIVRSTFGSSDSKIFLAPTPHPNCCFRARTCHIC